MTPSRWGNLLGFTRRSVSDHPRPVDPCDPIAEGDVLTIPLGGTVTQPNVIVRGAFDDSCMLVLDRRIAADVKVTIISSGTASAWKNVSITLGRIERGQIGITIAGSDVDLVVGRSPRLFCKFGLGQDSTVRVGDGTTSSGFTVSCQAGRVTIGRDCQTAAESMIMGAAHHGIVDLSSGRPELVAQQPDVRVGNHVWLGYRCYVGGAARVGDGCIVAAQASVVAPMPPNCLVAGNPARVRRRNVGWSRVPHQIDAGSRDYFSRLEMQAEA